MKTNATPLPLTAPYEHKIDNITFQVSAFGNPEGKESASQMLVDLMEQQVTSAPTKRKKPNKDAR